MEIPQIALLSAVGVLAGMIGALVGIGGGIVIVPLLTLGYGFSPALAAGTSLAVIVLNAASAVAGHAARRRIVYSTGILFGLASVPGALLGTMLLQDLASPHFNILFAAFLTFVGVNLLIRKDRTNGEDDPPSVPARWLVLGCVVSVAIGIFAALLGVGGGLFHVPLLIFAFRFSPRRAAATSCMILLFTSISAAGASAWYGHVSYDYALPLGVGVVAGAQLGTWSAGRVPQRFISIILAIILIAVATRMAIAI